MKIFNFFKMLVVSIITFLPIGMCAQTSMIDKIGNEGGTSSNNDKYWYGRYVWAKMDGNGNPIENSLKFIYPEKECSFEIQFMYTSETDVFPVYIFLNEINGDKRVKSEYIGCLKRSKKSSVEFKTDGINIFTPTYHLNVSSKGEIIIYETHNGKYDNGTIKMFVPDEAITPIYKVRYDVLIDKLKKIYQ